MMSQQQQQQPQPQPQSQSLRGVQDQPQISENGGTVRSVTGAGAPQKRRASSAGRVSGLNGVRGGGGSQGSLSSEGGRVVSGQNRLVQGGMQMSYSKVARGAGGSSSSNSNSVVGGGGGRAMNGIHGNARQQQQLQQQIQVQKQQQQQQQQQQQTNERMLHASVCSVGCRAQVQVRSGCVYEGVVSTLVSTSEEEGCSLKVCSRTRQGLKSEAKKQPPETEQVFNGKDLVMVEVFDVDMDGIVSDSGQLATDSAISGNAGTGLQERVLQPWVDNTLEQDSTFLELEENNYRQGSFDQFAVNQRRFGINPTFKEEEYTTKLDKSKCAITEEEAQRIADDIVRNNGNGNVARNVHLAEERGEEVDDDGLDEEEKYSSVVRVVTVSASDSELSRKGGNRQQYMPPHARRNLNSSQQTSKKTDTSEGDKSEGIRSSGGKSSGTTPTKVIPIPGNFEDLEDIKQYKMVSQYLRTGTKNAKSPLATPGQMSPLQESPMMKFVNQYNLDIGNGPQLDPKVQKEFIQWKKEKEMKKEPEVFQKQLNDFKEFSSQLTPNKIPHTEIEVSSLTSALTSAKNEENLSDVPNEDTNNNDNHLEDASIQYEQNNFQQQSEVEQQQQHNSTQELKQQSAQQQQQQQQQPQITDVGTQGMQQAQEQEDNSESDMPAQASTHEIQTQKSEAVETGAQTENEETPDQENGQSSLNPDAKEFTLNPTAREFVPFAPGAVPTTPMPQYLPPPGPQFPHQVFHPMPVHNRTPSSGSSPGTQTPNSLERYPPTTQQKQFVQQAPFPQYNPAVPQYHQPGVPPMVPYPHPHPYPYLPIPAQGPHMPPPQQFVNGRPPPQIAGYHPHPQYQMYAMHPQQIPPQMPIPMVPQGHYVTPAVPGAPVPIGMPPPGYIPAPTSGMVPPPVLMQQPQSQQQQQQQQMSSQYAAVSPRNGVVAVAGAGSGAELVQGNASLPPPPQMRTALPTSQQQQQQPQFEGSQQYYATQT